MSDEQEENAAVVDVLAAEAARVAEILRFEEARFKSPGSEVELFHHLAAVEDVINASSAQSLQPHIQSLHSSFLTLLVPNIPSYPYPKPGRPLRQAIARSIIAFHRKVESRSLFDFVAKLVKFVSENGGSAGKNGWDTVWRVACWFCIGEIMQALGSDMMSFMTDIATLTVKLIRATSQPVILRSHAIIALTKSLKTGGKAVADATAKDVYKYLRNGLSDNATSVQRHSADALVAAHTHLGLITTVSEIETINGLVYKAFEKADHRTRRPLARLVAHLLASTQDAESKAPLAPLAMLRLLSAQFNKQPSRRIRNAIMDVHATLFETLGSGFVETNYLDIVKYLISDVLLTTRNRSNTFETHTSRELISLLLRDMIGVRLLSEQAQIAALRDLSSQYLATPSSAPSSDASAALAIVLREIAGLLIQLGNAPPAIQDALQDPLIRLLGHTSPVVRIHAAWALRAFCSIAPLRLSKNLNIVLSSLEKDLSMIGDPTAPKDLKERILGGSCGLAAMIAVISERPLYVSSEVTMRVLDLAIVVIKRAADHEPRDAEVELEAAWTLVAALMTLGSVFVSLHLPQLLVLWRNALPKPTTKDTSVGDRGETDWSSLLQARESALTAIASFLRNNRELATLDVSRRISSLLTNTLNFVNGFATAYAEYLREQQQIPGASSAPKPVSALPDREAKLRRRTLECFTLLGASSATDPVQSSLLQTAVGILADPEQHGAQLLGTPAALPVWDSIDGYAFGVTSKRVERVDLKRDALELAIESQMTRPIPCALENDQFNLYQLESNTSAPPPATGVIDTAIDLFAALLPSQGLDVMMQTVTLMTNHLRSPKLDKNAGPKQAIYYNILVALQHALAARPALDIRVIDVIRPIIQDAVTDPEESLRIPAAACIGYLAAASAAQVGSLSQWLIDQIVANRSPESRSGSTLAFASIFRQIGGMNAGSLLRSIVSVLCSLSTDPHPLVHFSALHALSTIIDSVGLAFDPYVASTSRILMASYLAETHEPEGGSVGSSNLRGDLPAYQVICRVLESLIGVVGPELRDQESSELLLLMNAFSQEQDEGIVVETMGSIQQYLMFAPSSMDLPKLVDTFRAHLSSKRRPLRLAAINALYQIVQKDAPLMSKLGGNQLVEDLFSLLDEDPSMQGVREVILSWLRQTCAGAPSGWIALCQRIISRSSTAAKSTTKNASGLQDDESQSLGSAMLQTSVISARWRTQLFALECIHEIARAVHRSDRPEQFDLVLARRMGVNESQLLVSRLADLIKLAFAASTASTSQVRLQGLIVLRDVVESFATSMDPDFEGLPLLEQHQAPIAAALTPSFGSDAAPEVVASAIQVCAAFIGSGVVKDVSKMGRIVRLLTGALLRCEGKESAALGQVEELSSNASIMLKIATLTAWAELKVASVSQTYLNAVISPSESTLADLWVQTLRDYALLRGDVDADIGADVAQSGLAKDVLLPYYEDASFKILNALAIGMEADDGHALRAIAGSAPPQQGILPTSPLQHFFVLYGLAFELVAQSIGDSTYATKAVVALSALVSLVRVEYCGVGLFTKPIFDELSTICYRIAMAEPASVRRQMVRVMQSFAKSRALSGPVEHVRRALAIVTFALRSSIGSMETPSNCELLFFICRTLLTSSQSTLQTPTTIVSLS